MENIFSGQEKIGSIVATFPGAAELFKQYKIDFCCGGDRQLAVVLKEQGIDEPIVLAKLNQLYSSVTEQSDKEQDWSAASYEDLVSHIVNTHHAYLQRELPAISELLAKVLRAHGANHCELAQVHRLFNLLKLDLEQHLITEETELFPQILQYAANPSGELLEKTLQLVKKIENEHTQAGDILKQLDALTDHFNVPSDACASYRLAYTKLSELESDLFQHIHLENNILHPRLAGR